MSQCLFCENSLEIFCKECQESYCHHCGILKHLRNGSIQPHIIDYLCEECETEVSSVFCKSCEQNLCPACDIKIHNKGKRAQHTREPISNCFCMKDIKLVAHLTLDFLKDFCKVEDSEKFAETLDELSENILINQKSYDKSNIIFISVLDKTTQELMTEEREEVVEALKKIRLKQFLLFVGGDQDEDYVEFKQRTSSKDKTPGDSPDRLHISMRGAFQIHQIIKNIVNVESFYLFDVYRNESYAKALLAADTFEGKKIYLNMDPKGPQPFEATPYQVTKPRTFSKEDKIEVPILPSNLVPQLQIETQQKISSEPFLTQNILNMEQNELQDPLSGKERTYWANPKSPRNVARKKSNQSFDEIILNQSSDQVLQKRNAPFLKTQLSNLGQGVFSRRSNILYDQPLKNIELNKSIKLSHFFQLELRKFAEKGDLLIVKEDLVKKLSKTMQAKYNCKVEDVLRLAEELKLIHTTVRKFLDIQPLSYVGMLLDVLSIESLIWIVRSIKNDSMTPTEKLIISRTKECYGLKIEQNVWKNIITYIQNHQHSWNNKANSFEHASLFPLNAKKVLDPVTKTDTFVIYLAGENWVPEDQGTVDDTSEEWKEFLNFIEMFFREDDVNSSMNSSFQKMTPQELDSLDQSKKGIWSSSVENVLTRSTNKKEKSLKVNEDMRAIPGGRYGCAQFIKICGPEVLKKLSIGRLTLFVQETINRGILRYQKTLLVKNNPNDSIASTLTEVEGARDLNTSRDPTTERKAKLLGTIKDALIEILSETPEGISSAQIPLHLRRKMDCVVNFQELGFPKLKNFLATLPDTVKIESSGTKHAVVKLKNPHNPEGQESTKNSFTAQSNHNQILQPNLTSTIDEPTNFDYDKYKSFTDKKYNTTPVSDAKNTKNRPKKVSTLDDYLNKVKGLIELILTDNCYGISMPKLYKELSNKLSFDFDCRIFNCNDFYEFLVNHAENLLDIEIKRNCLIIYPKNFRFGPQTLVNVVNTDQQRASYDPMENKKNFFNNHYQNQPPYIHSDRSNKSSSELDTPPGLTKPIYKPNPSGFMPFNPPGFFGGVPSQPKINPKTAETNTGTATHTPNLSNISPIVFYGNEDEDAVSERQLLGHSRNVSYWKIDFTGNNLNSEDPRHTITSISQLNTGFHSRTESQRGVNKMQVQEETSNLDIKENLKFIEELLQDNEFNTEKSIFTNFTLDKTHESSFGGFQSPNLSFNGMTTIAQGNNTTLKQNHTKTQSEDFSNKNILKFANGGHGRVASVIPGRKNEE